MTQTEFSSANEPLIAGQHSTRDPFPAYRNRVIYSLTIASFVVFLPFVINNHFQARYELEVCLLSFLLILAIDAWAIYRDKPLPIPLWFLVFPVMAGFVLTILAKHYIGLVWAYPVVLLFFSFSLNARRWPSRHWSS